MNSTIKDKLQTLPEAPGSYQMLNALGEIIYVGKAKNLKNRVKTYFTGSHDQKTTSLVQSITDFTYIVTASELEAFLLELSLIKEHAPRYNIMLTGDKTYPYIEITNEKHPKLVITRKANKKNKNIFGPFPDAYSARETMHLLNKLFPFRKCQKLPKQLCLYFHIGQCLGPCVNPVEDSLYAEMIKKIKRFMSGLSQDLIDELKLKMHEHSEKMEYEKAKEYKELLDAVEKTTEKQKIIFSDLNNRDIINFHTYDNYMALSILFMRQGKIIFSQTPILTFYNDPEEAFLSYLAQFYEIHPVPDEVLLPQGIDLSLLEPILKEKGFIPQRGKKMQLMDMALENAKIHLQNNLGTYLKKHEKTIGALEKLGELLQIEPPTRIEAFDNSNTMGTNPVSSMVVFSNGLPDKKEYRKYAVKTIKGPDDYNTMKEIIYRRYQKMLYEDTRRPGLIIMDGGITQVHACKEILDSLKLSIPVVGLKKDDKHKTNRLLNLREQDILLDRHDPLYILLNKIQEEAHRFAVTFHRQKQSKEIYASILDAIPKIGKQTKTKLLLKFKTLENIKNALDEDLQKLSLSKKQIANLRIALEGIK